MSQATQTASPPRKERRSGIRYPCRLEAVCRKRDAVNAKACSARVVDLSCGGISLLVTKRFAGGDKLSVTLQTPTHPMPLQVQVLHATQFAPKSWLLGGTLSSELGREELERLVGG